MKRIVFIVYYDFEGVVDDYFVFLLRSMRKVAEKIVAVSNCGIKENEQLKLECMVDELIERENIGFDAGAYKDIFTDYYKDEKWENWDEIILMNDTFYGPVYPIQHVFEIMDSSPCDFWGITEQKPLKWIDGTILPPHIQSYFLAVRRKMLCSNSFIEFWKQLEYPLKQYEAVLHFEVAFSTFFRSRGYNYNSYVSMNKHDYICDDNSLVWKKYIYELVAISKSPFIKKKAIEPLNFIMANKTIEYVRESTGYDVEMIINHINRLDYNNKLVGNGVYYGFHQLESFRNNHKKVFLYGNGDISHRLNAYFMYKSWTIKGVIVTKAESSEITIPYDLFEPDEDTGIIIAVGRCYAEEVLDLVKKKMSDKHILMPVL